jgi:hypothetical protein
LISLIYSALAAERAERVRRANFMVVLVKFMALTTTIVIWGRSCFCFSLIEERLLVIYGSFAANVLLVQPSLSCLLLCCSLFVHANFHVHFCCFKLFRFCSGSLYDNREFVMSAYSYWFLSWLSEDTFDYHQLGLRAERKIKRCLNFSRILGAFWHWTEMVLLSIVKQPL